MDPTILFPHKELDPLPTDHRPNHTDVVKLQEQIYANATTSLSTRGGPYGHLGLCYPEAPYLLLPGAIAWVNPVHPGPAPVTPVNATAAQITEANRLFLVAQNEYALYIATLSALRNCLIIAIPAQYIAMLKHPTLGFATVSPRAILAHINTQYGHVGPDDLTANDAKLKKPWDPTEPIENLWTLLQQVQLFAAGHSPITDDQLTRAAVETLEKSGVFAMEIRDWRKKPDDQKILANLYSDFSAANKERHRQMTASAAGYANAATQQSNSKKDDASTTCNRTGATNAYYCWSHGVSKNSKHTSATCNNKFPNHCSDATIWDTKGGNRFLQTKPGLTQVWQKRPPRIPRANNAVTTPTTIVQDDGTVATGASAFTGASA